jgi:putative transposase
MARQPRYALPDGLTHVTTRGNRHEILFTDTRDRERFLASAGNAFSRFDVRCLSYCLMNTHIHFVVDACRADLSRAMHRLKGTYAQWFNWRHGLDGHLFQGRYHAIAVVSDWHLLELMRYVALNPVRAGMCMSPADWQWSSYGAVIGQRPAPCFLAVDRALRHFGRERRAAQKAFDAFVQEGRAARRLGA